MSGPNLDSSRRPGALRGLLHAGALVLLAAPATAGFFRVTERDGRAWLLDDEGKPFFCAAVNVVSLGDAPDKVKPDNPSYSGLKVYPSADAWARATADRLTRWGFTAIGGYADPAALEPCLMPYTVALTLGGWMGIPWADPLAPDSVAKFKELAAETAARRDDPLLIGYFVDNELGWWDEAIFTFWFGQPETVRLKGVLVDQLTQAYHGDLRAVLADFDLKPEPKTFADLKGKFDGVGFRPGRRPVVVDQFVEALADDYYKAVTDAVRAVDPHHLILGDRYASWYTPGVARAAGRYVDVVSTNFNTYAASGWIAPSYFESLHRLSGKPLMVTEYYFTAMENATGNRNRNGPFMVVPTQRERAAGAREMTERLTRLPYLVGHHWFQFADEPRNGRDDGEDFNFGLVDAFDQPYRELTDALASVNTRAADLHREGPKADGLVARGAAWVVPALSATPSADGTFGAWDLAATWAPGAAAAAPYEAFGDFHVAWNPQGLRLAAAFIDYSTGPLDPSVPASRARLEVTVARGKRRPATFTIVGFGEKVGPAPKDKKDDHRPLGPLYAVTPAGRPVPASRTAVRGTQSAVSVTSLGDVLIPAAALGGAPLKAGETIKLAVAVRLPGDARVTAWPQAPGPDGVVAPGTVILADGR